MSNLWLEWLTNDAPFMASDVADINALLSQLSERGPTLTAGDITETIQSGALIQIVRDEDLEDKIVGMATLIRRHQLMGRYGVIEDVIVNASHRGQGLGARLMSGLITRAKILNLKSLYLTSSPTRNAAQRLYEQLGFRRKETDVFTLTLNTALL